MVASASASDMSAQLGDESDATGSGGCGAGDEEEERNDELTSLPDASYNGEPLQQAERATNEEANNGDEPQPLARPPDDGQQYSKQFNRLDPNRRSFSTPAVNTLTGRQPTGGQADRPPVQWPDRGGRAKLSDKRAAGACAPANDKLRRRTALGLISFGSAHFRLPGASPQQQQQSGCASSTSRQANWRHWLMGKSSSAASEAGERPRTRAAGTRKFLLRNLKPQLGSRCSAMAEGKFSMVIELRIRWIKVMDAEMRKCGNVKQTWFSHFKPCLSASSSTVRFAVARKRSPSAEW